jgi:hypothetical protein
VAANPDTERYLIAMHLGMSGAKLSNITCSARGQATLEELKRLPPDELASYVIKPQSND